MGGAVAIDVEKAKYWMEKAVDHGYKLPSASGTDSNVKYASEKVVQ